MKSSLRHPISALGKVSLIITAATFGTWLFVNNAQNCLARHFVEKAPNAICWQTSNNYESTISVSQSVFLILLILAIVCSSITVTKLIIERSGNSRADNKRTATFMTLLSIILLSFIITVLSIYMQTTFNNNNYFLNTTSDAVIRIGSPIWLACTTAALTYWSKVVHTKAA